MNEAQILNFEWSMLISEFHPTPERRCRRTTHWRLKNTHRWVPPHSTEIEINSAFDTISLSWDWKRLVTVFHLTVRRLKTTDRCVPPYSTEIENNSSLSADSLNGDLSSTHHWASPHSFQWNFCTPSRVLEWPHLITKKFKKFFHPQRMSDRLW